MLPEGGVFAITIYQGADFRVRFEVRESDGITIIPLTGYTAHSQLRIKERTDSELLGVFECLVEEDLGAVSIHLEAEQTALLTGKRAFYDVFLTDVSGETTMLIEGQATVNPGVTVLEPV